MQNFIIQQMYDFIGNERFDSKTNILIDKIINDFGTRLSEYEKECLIGILMDLDKNSFESGVRSVISFFTGKNKF